MHMITKINYSSKLFVVLLLILSFHFSSVLCQISLNTTGNNPDPSAALDIDMPDKGLLIPRLTTAQRDAIASPANSLLIFNTTTQCLSGGMQWVRSG